MRSIVKSVELHNKKINIQNGTKIDLERNLTEQLIDLAVLDVPGEEEKIAKSSGCINPMATALKNVLIDKQEVVTSQELLLVAMVEEISNLSLINLETFEGLIARIKEVQRYIEDSVVYNLKESIAQALTTEDIRVGAQAKRASNSVTAFRLLGDMFGDIERSLKEFSGSEIASKIDKVQADNPYKWVSLKSVKDKTYSKFIGISYDNFSYKIKSGKDLSVAAITIVHKLKHDEIMRLAASTDNNTYNWGHGVISKPSVTPNGKKAPYMICPGLYIETGFSIRARVGNITKIFDVLGLDSRKILVELED